MPRRISANELLSAASALLLLAAAALALLSPGCREQTAAPIDRNQAPQTTLVGVPGDSTTTFYRVHLFWNGTDEDGEVVAYEWAITDSLPPAEDIEYERTTRTDSIFIFPVGESQAVLGHRFYVRAVDNEGKRDPTPAFSFFTVRNNRQPEAYFTRAVARGPSGQTREITSTDTRAPTDTIPSGWSVAFTWSGSDGDRAMDPDGTIRIVGSVSGYTYHLSPLEFGYLGGGLSDTTASYDPQQLESQTYVMYVRARDDAGLSTLDPAVRTFVWNRDPVTYFYDDQAEPGSADTLGHFYAQLDAPNGEWNRFSDGDTIPLTPSGIRVRGVVRAYDPDAPYVVTQYDARVVSGFGSFWTTLNNEEHLYQDGESTLRYTGDYEFQARSRDGLGRYDGSPSIIHFYIGYPARLVDSWKDENWEDRTQMPAEGGVYPAAPQDSVMAAYFAGYDEDYSDGLEFKAYLSRYPVPGGGQGADSELQTTWRQGLRVAQENGDEYVEMYPPQINLQKAGVHFIPGEYVLAVMVREHMPDARYGYRITEKSIRFTLE